MSLNKPFDLEHLGNGSYGVVMKMIENNKCVVVKQFYVQLYEETNSLETEVSLTKKAYRLNHDIFIKIIKDELSSINLAKLINIDVPFINNISISDFGYIYMEYMNKGDLYYFLKSDENNHFDITGILGCYFNGIYLLHNWLQVIHGDLTPMNILINYVGPHYKQKIIYNEEVYYIDTNGYNFKICDFGLANNIDNTKHEYCYINFLYRDYLLLFYLYFYQSRFYNYEKYSNIIEICVEEIKEILYNSYDFDEEYNFYNVCKFMDYTFEINLDNKFLYDIPNVLLKEFIEIYNN